MLVELEGLSNGIVSANPRAGSSLEYGGEPSKHPLVFP